MDEDFDSKANNIYFETAEMLHGDGSDNWAYDVQENNLHFYKEHFEKITKVKFMIFFMIKMIELILKEFIEVKKKLLMMLMIKLLISFDQFTEIQNKYMKDGKNNKNAKVIDL